MAVTAATGKRIVTKAIAFGDSGIGTAIKVADVGAGELVKRIWVEVATAWNSVTTDTLTAGLAKADLSAPVGMITADMKTAATGTANFFTISNPPATLGNVVGRALVACAVYFKVVSVGGSLSAGAATIYAEIETLEGTAGVAYAAASSTPTQTVASGESAGYV